MYCIVLYCIIGTASRPTVPRRDRRLMETEPTVADAVSSVERSLHGEGSDMEGGSVVTQARILRILCRRHS